MLGSLLIYALIRIFDELNHSNRTKTILLEAIGDGVVAVNASGHITLFNKAATKITGWLAGEVIGKHIHKALPFYEKNTHLPVTQFIDETIAEGKGHAMPTGTALTTKNGLEIPVADSTSPIFDEGKKATGAIIIFRDIQKELEAKSMRSDFAYMSHQLRSPVNKILWALEFVSSQEQNTQVKELVDAAYANAESMAKLIQLSIDVTNADNREVSVKLNQQALGGIVEEAIAKLPQPHPPITSATTKYPTVITDKELLFRIISLLLENAADYTPKDGAITVKGSKKLNRYILSVTDTGLGIPTEQQSLIFTKFFRGSNIDANKLAGAGLGLYLAKKYADLLGIEIWFNSKIGKGTSFYLSLPLE